jgi:parvulin-like peptidyl-prolyl isomerase
LQRSCESTHTRYFLFLILSSMIQLSSQDSSAISGRVAGHLMEATLFQLGEQSFSETELLSLLRRYQLMPHLIRGMVVDRAIADFPCTEAEQNAAIAQFYQKHQLNTPESQTVWKQKHHVDEAVLVERLTRSLRLETFKQAKWGQQLKSEFLKRKSTLDQVIYSLLRTKDRGLAYELYYRILEGEQSFAVLAQQFSSGDEARTGGQIGPVPLHQPHPAIRNLLGVSNPQQLWFPFQVEEWFVIVRLEQRLPAEFDTAMQQFLLNELFEIWLQEEIQFHLKQGIFLNA